MWATWSDRRIVLTTWTASRVWLALWAYLGHMSHPFRQPILEGYSGVPNWWLNVWTTFDSVHYIEIARQGYRPLTTAFFPLYPMLLRPFAATDNGAALAGIIISNVSFLVALFILLRLTTEQLGAEVGRRCLIIIAFFPSAVFSMAVYTDALFLLLSLSAFAAARNCRWKTAALWGALAALTRNAGAVLAAALLLEWWLRRRKSQSDATVPAALWLTLPMVVFAMVQVYFRMRFGQLMLLESQSQFGRALSWPWMPVWREIVDMMSPGTAEFSIITTLNLAASVSVFVIAWVYREKLRPSESLLMCGVMLMQLTYSRIWAPFTISSLRYVFSTYAFAQGITLFYLWPRSRVVKFGLVVSGMILSAAVSYAFGTKSFVS